MKRLVTFFAITLAILISFDGMAQMSKKEAKEWKKKLKKITPQSFKQIIDENNSLKSQISNLRSELDNVDDQLAIKNDQINQYSAQAEDLRAQLAAPSPAGNIDENVGVIFKVQIGAYEQINLSDGNSSNFGSEKGALNKYTIGLFKDYWEADTFKKYMREMGVKDAWIVAYKDGRRVDMKDVLEGKS